MSDGRSVMSDGPDNSAGNPSGSLNSSHRFPEHPLLAAQRWDAAWRGKAAVLSLSPQRRPAPPLVSAPLTAPLPVRHQYSVADVAKHSYVAAAAAAEAS